MLMLNAINVLILTVMVIKQLIQKTQTKESYVANEKPKPDVENKKSNISDKNQ